MLRTPQIKGDAEAAMNLQRSSWKRKFQLNSLTRRHWNRKRQSLTWNRMRINRSKLERSVEGFISLLLMVLQEALGRNNMCYEQALHWWSIGIKMDITFQEELRSLPFIFASYRFRVQLLSRWRYDKRDPFEMKTGSERTKGEGDCIHHRSSQSKTAHILRRQIGIQPCSVYVSGSYDNLTQGQGELVYGYVRDGVELHEGRDHLQGNFCLESAMELWSSNGWILGLCGPNLSNLVDQSLWPGYR